MDQNHPKDEIVLLQISNFHPLSGCISVLTAKTIHFILFTTFGHDSGHRLWRWRFGFGTRDSKVPASAWQGHDMLRFEIWDMKGYKRQQPQKWQVYWKSNSRDCSSPIWTVVKAETCRRCSARDSPRKTPEIGLPELQFQLVSAVKFDDFFFRMQQCFVSLFQGQQLKSILIEDS